MQRYSWFDITNVHREDLENICKPNSWCIISPSQLPSWFPNGLKSKLDSVLVVASQSFDGIAFWMFNANRVDPRQHAIDQNPVSIAFSGSDPIGSGCIIQHGTWSNRTIEPPEEFWNYSSSSGIGNCYPITELPNRASGNIDELQTRSNLEAFQNCVNGIKQTFT